MTSLRRLMSRTSYTAIAKPYDEFVKTVYIGMATTIKPQTHIQSGRVEISCAGPETSDTSVLTDISKFQELEYYRQDTGMSYIEPHF